MTESASEFLEACAASAVPAEAGEKKRDRRDAMICNQSIARPSTRRPMRLRGRFCALAGAAAALALLLTVPTAPAGAVDCGTLTQGTYDRDNDVFTPGTAVTDIDYSVDCADADGDSLTLFGVDQIPSNLTEESYVVVNVGGSDPFQEDDAATLLYVIKASGIDTAETNQKWRPRSHARRQFLVGRDPRVGDLPGRRRKWRQRLCRRRCGHGDSDQPGNHQYARRRGHQRFDRWQSPRPPCGLRPGSCLRHEPWSHRDPRRCGGCNSLVHRHRRHGNDDQLRDRNRSGRYP